MGDLPRKLPYTYQNNQFFPPWFLDFQADVELQIGNVDRGETADSGGDVALSALAPADMAKLVAILGMLGSDYNGEGAVAGLAASRLLNRLRKGDDDPTHLLMVAEAPDNRGAR